MNKLKIINNPIDILLNIFESNYAELANIINEISFAEIEEGLGVCVFFDDGTVDVHLNINNKDGKTMDVLQVTDILAHELAHIIVGQHHEHDKEWEKAYDHLWELYMQEADKITNRETTILKEDKINV